MACPSVMTPRTTGQPIHGCFSESRSSGSECVEMVPSGLRTEIPQACGERIITPSSTACPPTRVSSPLSSAGRSWTAVMKRRYWRNFPIAIGCPSAANDADIGSIKGSRFGGGVKPVSVTRGPCIAHQPLIEDGDLEGLAGVECALGCLDREFPGAGHVEARDRGLVV